MRRPLRFLRDSPSDAILLPPGPPGPGVGTRVVGGREPATGPAGEGGRPRRAVGRREALVSLVVMAALSVGWFWAAWSAPGSRTVGAGGDTDAVLWILSWFPYALGHGMDPLVSHYVAAPQGANLMWNTSMPLLSFLLSPLTVAAGPTASFDLVSTAAPALTGWVSYLAFRRWARAVPALAGALAVGFSPFMAAESFQHPFLTFYVSAPLLLILLDRLLVVQRAPAWRDGIWLGLVVWAQLLVSEEMLAMEAIAAVVGVVALIVAGAGAVRARLRHALGGLGVAAGVFAVLGALPLAVQFLGPYRPPGRIHLANIFVADLWSFVAPTWVTQLGGTPASQLTSHFSGNYTEWGTYVGIPVLALVALAIVLCRRRRVTWVALTVAVVTAGLSLGSPLHVGGQVTGIPTPWAALERVPVLRDLLPVRLASVMWVALGLLIALALDELWDRRPALSLPGLALGALALVSIVPLVPYPTHVVQTSSAFAGGAVCPPRAGARAKVLPTNEEAMLIWQEQAGYCFEQTDATGLIAPGTSPPRPPLYQAATAAELDQPMPDLTFQSRVRIQEELSSSGVVEVVIGPSYDRFPPAARERLSAWMTDLLGAPPVPLADSLIWEHPQVHAWAPPPQGQPGPSG